MIAVLNAQSAGNKSAAIYDRVATDKPSICAIIETWHDTADCPSLIACTMPGYGCLERAHPRSTAWAANMRTNHGGFCLLHLAKYTARVIPLPVYKTFEVLSINLHGAAWIFWSSSCSTIKFDNLSRRIVIQYYVSSIKVQYQDGNDTVNRWVFKVRIKVSNDGDCLT